MDVASAVSHPSFKTTDDLEPEYIYVKLEKNVKDKMVHIFEHLNLISTIAAFYCKILHNPVEHHYL